MSIKVYNGWKLVDEPFRLIGRLSERLTAARQAVAARLVCESAVAIVDGLEQACQMSPARAASQRLTELNTKISQTGIRNPHFDLGCSVAFLAHDTGFYGLVYCEQPAMLGAFEQSGGMAPWPWWNNSDPDGEASDWDARRSVWLDLLGCGQTPAQRGLVWDPFRYDELWSFSWDELKPWIPTDPARAAAVATRRARDIVAAEMGAHRNTHVLFSSDYIARVKIEAAAMYDAALESLSAIEPRTLLGTSA